MGTVTLKCVPPFCKQRAAPDLPPPGARPMPSPGAVHNLLLGK